MIRWKSKLRTRMMLAHISVFVAVVLFIEILCASATFFVIAFSPELNTYLPLPSEATSRAFMAHFAEDFLLAGIIILLISIPIAAGFSLMSSRGLLGRMQHLVDATTQFVAGHYQQRVEITNDEFGLLEEQFNIMGEQLVESIEQRRMLTEQNARMAERARILRDLHDGVKQQAFALTMQISTALALLETQPEVAHVHLRNSETLAYQVQQELTMLLQSSRPSGLSEKGLTLTLQEYVTTWSRQQQISVQQHLDTCTLPPLLEEALLRIAQEALSNSARHSHASTVILNLSCKQGIVTLMLEDNGCGFDPDAATLARKNNIGLRSMHERIEAFHGTLRIESQSGAGTRIIASCPAPPDKESPGMTPYTLFPLPDKEVTP